MERHRDVVRRRVRRQARDGLDELVDEGVAAQLPVGDDVHARPLLHRDRLVHRAVLDALVVHGRELPRLGLRAGAQQVVGAQQRAHGIGA